MQIDLLLASLHHLLMFALVAMLVAEQGLLRARLDPVLMSRLVRLDAAYGACAGLLLLAGLLRVAYGIKGAGFYLSNPWFHSKLTAFVLVALLSIRPTMQFFRWRKSIQADSTFVPPPAEIARARRVIRLELALIAMIFVLAAAMARHGGF